MDSPGFTEFGRIAQESSYDEFFSIPFKEIDLGRESMPLLDINGSFGRESLGILRLGCDSNDLEQPTNNFTLNNLSEFSSQNLLDRGFWLSPSRTLDLKNYSQLSITSNFSFNPKDLDQPSSILNMGSMNSVQFRGSVSMMNDAFLVNNGTTFSIPKLPSRLLSLPAPITKRSDADIKFSVNQMRTLSEGNGLPDNEVFKEEKPSENGDYLDDSVFIEALHLSTKFCEEATDDGFILDETDPPDLVGGDLEESQCDKKCDKEEIFKKIDKLLPVDGYQKLNAKLGGTNTNNSKNSSFSKEIQEDGVTINEERQDQDNVSHKETILESTSDNIEKSEKILKTLSEILAKGNISEKDNQQGQSLLHTLSDILGSKSRERSRSFTSNRLRNNDDQEENCSSYRSKEDSNLSNSSSTSNRILPGSMLKRHSNSFSHPTKSYKPKFPTALGRSPSFDASKNYSSGSEKSVEIKRLNVDPSFDFKTRKTAAAPSRRGPLKATVPVENLSKVKLRETPPKALKLPVLNSRVSTPIREMQLKPMAQSTPDNKLGNSSTEQSNTQNSSSQKPGNESSSVLSSFKESSLSKDQSSLHRSLLPRRNSISEPRKPISSSQLRRSNSMKEPGLVKAMKKIRHNTSTSGLALRDCSNLSSKEGSSCSLKLSDTPRKVMKAPGKENTVV